MTNQYNGTLYIGVTNNIERRVFEHKAGEIEGFTKDYFLNILVYFEETDDINVAIAREKQLKNWHRQWKINLVETINPEWRDLSDDFSDR